VLRAGKVSGRVDPRKCSNAQLSELMIGHAPAPLTHAAQSTGEVALACTKLSLPALSNFQTALSEITLEVRAGEVVGIAGVSGNGQQELFAALSGEDLRAKSGIFLLGRDCTGLGPAARRALSLAHVPEERLGRGAVPSMSLAQNSLLTSGFSLWQWIKPQQSEARAAEVIERYKVKAGGPRAAAASLSGGNLQKFIVGRELSAKPRVLMVAQPTWGVDVGSAAQIRAAIAALADEGSAVLVVSEELDELFELCDRLYVMARGKLSPSIQRADADVATIGAWMSGLWLEAGHA
jgi:general nucleoside transport system ATP-binding protein